jgi:hypothetical protein
MGNQKPYETIAMRFKVSDESAKYFLGRVQKSFKKVKPPQALILDFMAGLKLKTLPKPYEIAKLMSENDIWQYPLHAEPAAPEDEKDAYFS